MNIHAKRFAVLIIAASGFSVSALAGESRDFTVVIREHRFTPQELIVPAGQKFKLIVDNQDTSPEEFESKSLHREKVIPGHKQGVINLGPLKPGQYDFFGEFHESTAQGRLIAQ